jgi:hypothetical protein
MMKVNIYYILFILVTFCVSQIAWFLMGWEWTSQTFKDVLLYAIVWRVFYAEVKNG